MWKARQSGFMNGREEPYFPNATNRVLGIENREKEAIRALGKINQERLRRSSENAGGAPPLPWGPFWSEWKKTHPLDGESEGFSNLHREHRGGDETSFLPNY
jgi:hypothetical protein